MEFSDASAVKTLRGALISFRKIDGADFKKYKFGERAFTHRLAHFLAEIIEKEDPTLRVDCEYNRNMLYAKRAPLAAREKIRDVLHSAKKQILEEEGMREGEKYPPEFRDMVKELLKIEREVLDPEELEYSISQLERWGDLAGHLLYPDIIVHTRGINKNNKFVIEAKLNETSDKRYKHDLKKLDYYVTPQDDETAGLNYQYGFYINVDHDAKVIKADMFPSPKDINIVDELNKAE